VLVFVIISLFSAAVSGCGLYYEYPRDDVSGDGSDGSDSDCYVREVIDGDTVVLGDGNHVRLLGINTPEKGMYFCEEASEVLEAMVLDRDVRLEMDVTDRDMYGRMLRYVFLGDLFVNLEMVKRGFANIYTCPPDVKYADDILEAERYARENNMGLWELSETSDIRIEVVYDAPGNDNENVNGEYVMLENRGDEVLDTEGWTVKDSGTNIYTFSGFDFYPGDVVKIFSGVGGDSEGVLYWGSDRPVWNNDSDTLYLRDGNGLLMGVYGY